VIIVGVLFVVVITIPRWNPDSIGKKPISGKDTGNIAEGNRSPSLAITRPLPNRDAKTSSSEKTLADFRDAILECNRIKKGAELREATYVLIHEASTVLSLEDLQEFCNNLKGLDDWRIALRLLGIRYAEENFEAGLDWLSSLSAEPGATAAFAGFGSKAPSEHAPRLLDLAGSLGHRRLSDGLIGGLIANGDNDTMMLVVQAINRNPDLIGNVTASRIPERYLEHSDYEAALRVVQSLEDASTRRDALGSVMRHAGNTDAGFASDLVGGLKDEGDKAAVVGLVVAPWIRMDPEAASAWVAGLEPGMTRDAASSSVSKSMLGIDDRMALEWARSINDDAMRDRATQAALDFIRLNNPKYYETVSEH
jgi:hypothetical protein